MKGLKKLALASAVLAISTGAFAMEALQDDDMSNATGQAGLTIETSGTSITASAIRYYDSTGFNSAATNYAAELAGNPYLFTSTGDSTGTPLPGPCSGITATACVGNFTAGGALNLSNFSLTEGASTTTIDIGSTGTTSGDTTGLLIGASANNLTVSLGAISIDNGTELDGSAYAGSAGRAATNAPSYNAGGFLTSGKDLGGLAISSINLPPSLMIITAGAAQLANGTTGAQGSGLTITQLLPIADLSLTVSYYNTATESYTAGSGFTANTAAGASTNDGIISLPINLIGVLTGPVEIAVGKAGGGYATTSTEGLDILTTGTSIGAVDIGSQDLGGTGVQIAGTTVGSIGILNLKVGSQFMAISGH